MVLNVRIKSFGDSNNPNNLSFRKALSLKEEVNVYPRYKTGIFFSKCCFFKRKKCYEAEKSLIRNAILFFKKKPKN